MRTHNFHWELVRLSVNPPSFSSSNSSHLQVVKGMLGTNTHLEANIEEVLSTHRVSLYTKTT